MEPSVEAFKTLLRAVTDKIAGQPLNSDLEAFLNSTFAPESTAFRGIEQACHAAVAQGWMCAREHGGIRYGRVIAPDADLAGFSVDVVQMKDVVGPHHSHPEGEIDMVMPITPGARFDGAPRGWKVYGPHSAHHPTVTQGDALVLYLLPQGRIEFTK